MNDSTKSKRNNKKKEAEVKHSTRENIPTATFSRGGPRKYVLGEAQPSSPRGNSKAPAKGSRCRRF